MIEIYAILAFPLALFLQKALLLIKPIKIIVLSIFIILTFYSVFQSAQYYYCAIHWDSMSRKAYFDSLIIPPNYESAMQGRRNQ